WAPARATLPGGWGPLRGAPRVNRLRSQYCSPSDQIDQSDQNRDDEEEEEEGFVARILRALR
ncbi:hypothetical protein, partial [Streptomyces sp. NPDC059538]|uniref:hypothetical protein n=1 Tax=Streptomyces sp. NPDC059538 TaxID=3346860 RepID=UPI00369973CB